MKFQRKRTSNSVLAAYGTVNKACCTRSVGPVAVSDFFFVKPRIEWAREPRPRCVRQRIERVLGATNYKKPRNQCISNCSRSLNSHKMSIRTKLTSTLPISEYIAGVVRTNWRRSCSLSNKIQSEQTWIVSQMLSTAYRRRSVHALLNVTLIFKQTFQMYHSCLQQFDIGRSLLVLALSRYNSSTLHRQRTHPIINKIVLRKTSYQ